MFFKHLIKAIVNSKWKQYILKKRWKSASSERIRRPLTNRTLNYTKFCFVKFCIPTDPDLEFWYMDSLWNTAVLLRQVLSSWGMPIFRKNQIEILLAGYIKTRRPIVVYRSPEIQFHERNQSWPLYKKVKGQPRVIIWANLLVLECPILYTKFQWYWPFGSEEENF